MKRGSKWFYGRFRDGDKIRQIRLDVEIEGRRPARISETGDRTYERSRGAAQKEFEKKRQELRGDPMAERSVQRLIEIKTGREAQFPLLEDLPALWDAIPRRRKPNAQYARHCQRNLQRFVDFAEEKQPHTKEFATVTPETARAFMDAEEARGMSPKTYNDTLKLLRATFKHLHPQLNEGSSPFHGLVTKETETVNREPYSVEELRFILEASKKDPLIRPVIVTGMCTAMRRGDCCLLKWADVDLQESFITVKTSKTGETVDIPIFPLLQEALREAKSAAKNRATHCFPEAARMYQRNPDGITWRVKKVLADANRAKDIEDGAILPEVAPDEVRRRGVQYLGSLANQKRAQKMLQVFELYVAEASIDEVIVETGLSKGSVSLYLNEIEENIGCAFIRGKVRKPEKESVQVSRDNGTRRASVRDFHSFRVTWITLALAAGVPLELVQRVTGHRTVEVVLKHYFRPGREDFRRAIQKAMPKMFVQEPEEPVKPMCTSRLLDSAITELEKATTRTWRKRNQNALQLVRQAKERYDEDNYEQGQVAQI